MELIIVAAVSDNLVLGNKGEILWDMPADVAFLKNTIKDGWLLTGRTSFESAQGSDIFDHRDDVIILTRNESYKAGNRIVKHSITDAIDWAKAQKISKLYNLGGGHIYNQTIDIADLLIITWIHYHFEGDTFFPKISPQQWEMYFEEKHPKDGTNPYDYTFTKYKRR